MKLRLHHIEICVKDPTPSLHLFCDQLGLNLLGYRESNLCIQYVLKLAKTVFLITSRKGSYYYSQNNNHRDRYRLSTKGLSLDPYEYWSNFCCPQEDPGEDHIDSVFNVAIEVENLQETINHIKGSTPEVIILKYPQTIHDPQGTVRFALIKSCCGNVVHTLIQKDEGYGGWFLPGFRKISSGSGGPLEEDPDKSHLKGITMSFFDHFTLACRVGETDGIIEWYERIFGMKRFITNREDSESEGLVIGDDVGLRLKVMEFWKCSEAGIMSQSQSDNDDDDNDSYWEPMKIVIAESLPNIRNTQIENFIEAHGGPGIQHVGLHTDKMIDTVQELTKNGVKFRHPPPTYYTEVGQLNVIKSTGEDVDKLRELGILLDNEADVFDDDNQEDTLNKDRYLMQVFTHPIFLKDTFFLEVIQRKGARGFGVGNVTALARSVNAYQEMLKMKGKGQIENN